MSGKKGKGRHGESPYQRTENAFRWSFYKGKIGTNKVVRWGFC